eukprot:GHRR01021835.1.p2 GENE.GHRR01021835.1~~GHRR01021835.1.p2  ORF type:complete len:152 (-),score=31.18 GHRR01021835.1:319-774(-)
MYTNATHYMQRHSGRQLQQAAALYKLLQVMVVVPQIAPHRATKSSIADCWLLTELLDKGCTRQLLNCASCMRCRQLNAAMHVLLVSCEHPSCSTDVLILFSFCCSPATPSWGPVRAPITAGPGASSEYVTEGTASISPGRVIAVFGSGSLL